MSALQQQKAALTSQVEHQETHSHSLQSALTFKEQDWQQVRLLACRDGGASGNLDIGIDQYTGKTTHWLHVPLPASSKTGVAPCWVSTCMHFTVVRQWFCRTVEYPLHGQCTWTQEEETAPLQFLC